MAVACLTASAHSMPSSSALFYPEMQEGYTHFIGTEDSHGPSPEDSRPDKCPPNIIHPPNDNPACNNRVHHNVNKHISDDELDFDVHHINCGLPVRDDGDVCLLLDNDLAAFVHYYLIDEYATFMDEALAEEYTPLTSNVMIPPTPVVAHFPRHSIGIPFQYSSNLTAKQFSRRRSRMSFIRPSNKRISHPRSTYYRKGHPRCIKR